MSNKTRKYIWPVSLAMSLALIGALAAVVAFGTVGPQPAVAHGPCSDLITSGDPPISEVLAAAECVDDGGDENHPHPHDDTGDTSMMTPAGATLQSSSSTGSAAVKLTLTIDLEQNLTGSSWVEIYLEDDYQEPGSIAKEDVVFEARGTPTTGGSDVDVDTTFAAADVEIDDGGDLNGEDNAVVISARIPDMKNGDATGYPKAGQTLYMVVSEAAGIRNPSEDGSHDTGYSIISGIANRAGAAEMENIGDGDNANTDGKLLTKAKISLSADDGGRGKEVTITGTGFNNGVDAEAFVLVKMTGDAPDCQTIIDDGDSLGTANVGSDDKFAIVFTVHQDEFKPGEVNYICAEDSEAGDPRKASAVKPFKLTASISLDPAEADSGEEVTLKARDFGGALTEISLGPDQTWTADDTDTDDFSVKKEDNDYTFEVPGGLSGVIQVAAKRDSTRKTADLTITPSSLTLNQTEVAPNQSIIISGSGFSEDSYVLVEKITIDGEPLAVDGSGVEDVTRTEAREAGRPDDVGEDAVKTTSSGQFTVTVNVWHVSVCDANGENCSSNPALDDGDYTVKATDGKGYEGKATITILEPSLSVNPVVASPRDSITIRGANWPVSTSDDDNDVTIMVEDKERSAPIDSTGRFNYSYQLSGSIDIGMEHDITVMFDGGVGGNIEETITFSVPSANVVITPAAAAPGESIDLEISGMPIYERVTEVMIDGGNRLGGTAINTDSEGDVTITGIVIPFADPGFYPVKIVVGTGGSAETAIVQLEILAESDVRGVASPLPESVMDLGENLVRVFHFNTSSKVWTFYDPRPEFDGLNTLTELAAGQPYWILVSENVEDVVLNGRTRDLTCVGGDCWNQLVW